MDRFFQKLRMRRVESRLWLFAKLFNSDISMPSLVISQNWIWTWYKLSQYISAYFIFRHIDLGLLKKFHRESDVFTEENNYLMLFLRTLLKRSSHPLSLIEKWLHMIV